MSNYLETAVLFTIKTGKYWIDKIANLFPEWLIWPKKGNETLALSHPDPLISVDTCLPDDSITPPLVFPLEKDLQSQDPEVEFVKPLLLDSVFRETFISSPTGPQLIFTGDARFIPIDSNTNSSENNINIMQSTINREAVSEATILGLLGLGLYWKYKLKISQLKKSQQKLFKESHDKLQELQQENQLLKLNINKINTKHIKYKEKLQKRLQFKEETLQKLILQHKIEMQKKDQEIFEVAKSTKEIRNDTIISNLQIQLNSAIQRIQRLEIYKQINEPSEETNALPRISSVSTDQSILSLHSQPQLQNLPKVEQPSTPFQNIMKSFDEMSSILTRESQSSVSKDTSHNNRIYGSPETTNVPILMNFNRRLLAEEEPTTPILDKFMLASTPK